MGDRIARRERPSGMKMALKLTIFMAIAAVAICDESLISKEDMTKMSKDQLVSALQEAQSHNTKLSKKLSHAKKEIASFSYEDDFPTAAEEAKRKHKELAKKAALKKKSDAKRAAKMKKTEKLSDILMDHGAKFLAFKAAKKTQSAGSVKQGKAVMLAATKGVVQVPWALSGRSSTALQLLLLKKRVLLRKEKTTARGRCAKSVSLRPKRR